MCGIVGAVAKRPIEKILLEGLKRLEYRGYDSAGMAVISKQQVLKRLRVKGKVRELETALTTLELQGETGIAHTRWATHGAPSEHNAHPFVSHDAFALVHNGIIENYAALRQQLQTQGYVFTSETDTEAVVHLLHQYYAETKDLLAAVRYTVKKLEGAFALAIMSAAHPDRLIAVRRGSPLVIGKGNSENFIASDPLALLSVTQQFIYLEDDDIADLRYDDVHLSTMDGKAIARDLHTLTVHYDAVERGQYRHYMSKEIMEQPQALARCLEDRLETQRVLDSAFTYGAQELFARAQHVQLVACGTSYHAAMVARYWLEAIAGVACTVEIASEFRYRKRVIPTDSLFVVLSQSGETADTLAALRIAKKENYLATLGICNVPESTLVREADHYFLTRAGIEIGVASTKAFTTQLLALLFLTAAVGRRQLSADGEKHLVTQLRHLPVLVEQVLKLDEHIVQLATHFADKQHALFLGRDALYPVALEGALKLKEISYIHAEGYPAGELKHGPLALIDKLMPVIALAPKDGLIEKLHSNLQEVYARGGALTIFTDEPNLFADMRDSHIVAMPSMDPLLMPIAYVIPLQLLAYHVAVLKGTDVDQPRNLAKSVTVE
ncbi:MAG TPA: glutamine--fructose-6-phosphate transaminase (isomerizing) [Gammaproteobacteria bacterium]|nr:MAG: glutamine--fructose-6-phosphate aminotransferase [Gammaproteobacteria bacterium RIFCSPHIGHO2_12_FULL_41_20]HLB43490.1 glutamine--fructose-6-phosphate transaminase (isomerizing) [Gammaproteobacteria bacterium]